MVAELNLGSYEIDEDGNGDLVIKDTNGNIVVQWDKSAGRWKLPANAPIEVSELIDGAGQSHTGELADQGDPGPHTSQHEDGGSDELTVTGLSGDLADAQDPKSHGTTHRENGSDELTVGALGANSNDTSLFYGPDGSGGVQLKSSGALSASEVQQEAAVWSDGIAPNFAGGN